MPRGFRAFPQTIARSTIRALRKTARIAIVSLLGTAFLSASFPHTGPTKALAAGENRTLWLHFTHTGEEKQITFRRDGKYDPEGIKQLQWILRDWRRNLPTTMDPRLFDLIWSVYQEAHATGPIHVVSGFRSKQTNDSLRRRSSGVAKFSQHTQGKAMDFYIPGVPIKKLREIGLKMQVGGVGYYPGSKSPFVHMDTGNVRHWPRLTPSQIAAIFPDGKTLHLDTAGRKQAQYDLALAEYNARRNEIIQPLSYASSSRTRIASNDKPVRRRTGGLLASLFNSDRKEKDETQRAQDKPQNTPQTAVAAAEPEAPEIPETTEIPVPTLAPKPEGTPAIIANTLPNTAPVPSRIGRAEESDDEESVETTPEPAAQPQATVTAALAPAPRPVPGELRDRFAPPQSIVVANVPSPYERPRNASGNAPGKPAAPKLVVATADIPEATQPSPRGLTSTQTATPSETKTGTKTDALARNDFDGEARPASAPQNRRNGISDPTRLVLNEPTLPASDPNPQNTKLAYAPAAPSADRLPKLNADEFNNRFGAYAATEAPNIGGTSSRTVKELTVAERFAALELKPEAPAFSLKDIGIDTEEAKLALRQSLGLVALQDTGKSTDEPVAVASLDPEALALSGSGAAAQEWRAHTADKQPKGPSLTNTPGTLVFSGENRKIVSALLISASFFDEARMELSLPDPNRMPTLFVSPTRAYAGAFLETADAGPANFQGETITVTPTVEFDRIDNPVRLSWLSR